MADVSLETLKHKVLLLRSEVNVAKKNLESVEAKLNSALDDLRSKCDHTYKEVSQIEVEDDGSVKCSLCEETWEKTW